MYWSLGKMIVCYKRKNNSKYGNYVVKKISEELYAKYGTGFNRSNIFYAIQFYELFPTVHARGQLGNISWTHIRELLRFKDVNIINFYLKEVAIKNFSYRDLLLSIKSKSYERTIFNQRKGNIKHVIEKELKDPPILGIENKKRTEKELENEILKNIPNFIKEIGNNIMFYDRQLRINHNGLIYKVDIVLYDKKEKYFILIDLKINKVTRKDVSQMRFYIDCFNKYIKEDSDSNTIGLILCETKDVRVETNDDIYQIKYLNQMPKENELLKIINENKIILLKTETIKIDNKTKDLW
jgi:predicted nuclease of restriction endonuclease-like (RecB) superfamily